MRVVEPYHHFVLTHGFRVDLYGCLGVRESMGAHCCPFTLDEEQACLTVTHALKSHLCM